MGASASKNVRDGVLYSVGQVDDVVWNVSYDFCFNGAVIGPIIPSRGIRQGDPISPCLFLFCVEGLSLSLYKAASEEVIHGVKVSRSALAISHLLFADD